MVRDENNRPLLRSRFPDQRLRVVNLANSAEEPIQRALTQASTPAGKLPVRMRQISK